MGVTSNNPQGEPPLPGPDRAVARWARDHAGDLYRFLAKRRIVESDIKDVCQEVYLRILRFERSEVVQKPSAYLFRVAANVAHDFKLRQARWLSLDAEALDQLQSSSAAEQVAESDSRQQAVRTAVERLPPLLRAAIVLQSQEDLTYEAISQRLGVSHRVVKRSIARAHALLREALAKDL